MSSRAFSTSGVAQPSVRQIRARVAAPTAELGRAKPLSGTTGQPTGPRRRFPWLLAGLGSVNVDALGRGRHHGLSTGPTLTGLWGYLAARARDEPPLRRGLLDEGMRAHSGYSTHADKKRVRSVVSDQNRNASIIGRLLEEISWEGSRVRLYRRGGLGMENVLTTEVMLPLSFLPRTRFLGEVLRSAHGADAALTEIAAEIEEAEVLVLPPELNLQPAGTVVQPDAVIRTAGGYVLMEAKRVRAASFGPQQLAREYLAVLREAGTSSPVLLLVLGSPPPITVKKQGLRNIGPAITEQLTQVLTSTGSDSERFQDLAGRIPDVVSWITWAEIAGVVTRQLPLATIEDPSLRSTVERLSAAVTSAIAAHS